MKLITELFGILNLLRGALQTFMTSKEAMDAFKVVYKNRLF